MLLGLLRTVFGDVPLVDTNHEAFLVTLYQREDIGVLCFYAACGVNHQYADIRSLDGADRANHRVILNVLVDLLLLAYAGGVDKVEVKPVFVVAGVDAVAGGAGDVGDYVAVFAYESVDER